ncbi:MAG TPA: alpha/beta hydrolase [Phycisphaerales bacterium]|nr:alpha/beta hydrolase [Phycisphaerales bacterium]
MTPPRPARVLIATLGAASALAIAAAQTTIVPPEHPALAQRSAPTVAHRFIEIDGVRVFYREAGPADGPVVLLLHGFPTSSHMFRDLIPTLADRYRVIAPDYPGFGNSDAPPRDKFAYTFDNYSKIVGALAERLGAKQYALYLMDYGAPVGYRLAARHPERVSALIVQNGNAYEEGLKAFWDPIKKYWADPAQANRDALRTLLTRDATIWQYTHGTRNPAAISPDNWNVDQPLLDRPGNNDIQLDLFYDYRTNVPLYPAWQEYFRTHQPPTLIVWGKNDHIFPADGAYPYLRDLKDIEFHLLNTGHFALEEDGATIGALISAFLAERL